MTNPALLLYQAGTKLSGGTMLGSDPGPFEFGGVLYCFAQVILLSDNSITVQVFKSTDSGLTWTEQDSANAPDRGLAGWYDGNGHFYFVHDLAHAGKLVVKKFTCGADTFGADSADGPDFSISGHPCMNAGIRVLSNDTIVVAYRPTGGGFSLVELIAGVWGTPTDVSLTSFELIMGMVLAPGDVVYVIWQLIFPFPRTMWSTQWASSAVVGSPVAITALTTSFDEWTLNGGDTTMSYPGLYSSSLGAIIFALYNFSDPSDFTMSLLVGTIGTPISWSVIAGPVAPMPIGVDGDVSPRLAFNADESTLLMSLTATSDIAVDSRIILWTSSDHGTTWTSLPDFYNANTDPPDPPPTTIDAIEFPSLKILADGTIATVMGIGTSPTFFFCGVEYYFSIPAPPAGQTLELTKIVSGGTASPADFLLSAVGGSPETDISGAGHVGPTEVSPGVYELSETSTSSPSWGDATWGVDLWGGDYSPQPWDCGDAEMPTPTSVVVPEGGTVACSITNVSVPIPPPPGPGQRAGESCGML